MIVTHGLVYKFTFNNQVYIKSFLRRYGTLSQVYISKHIEAFKDPSDEKKMCFNYNEMRHGKKCFKVELLETVHDLSKLKEVYSTFYSLYSKDIFK